MRLKGIASHHRTIIKVIEWLGLITFFSILFITLWGLIWNGRSDINSLKWLQLFQSLGVFLLPAFTAAYLWSDNPARYLHLNSAPRYKDAGFAIIVIIIALPAINLLGYINQQVVLPDFLHELEEMLKEAENNAAALTESFLKTDSIIGLLANIGLMALLPAICEESCFRGILQQLLCNDKMGHFHLSHRQHTAIWATAIIFSLIHFQFYGFLPRMLLGALLGYLLAWTGCLWIPVIAHFTNNAIAVITYYVAYKTDTFDVETMDTFGTGNTLWLGITGILATIALIIIYIRYSEKKLNDEKD